MTQPSLDPKLALITHENDIRLQLRAAKEWLLSQKLTALQAGVVAAYLLKASGRPTDSSDLLVVLDRLGLDIRLGGLDAEVLLKALVTFQSYYERGDWTGFVDLLDAPELVEAVPKAATTPPVPEPESEAEELEEPQPELLSPPVNPEPKRRRRKQDVHSLAQELVPLLETHWQNAAKAEATNLVSRLATAFDSIDTAINEGFERATRANVSGEHIETAISRKVEELADGEIRTLVGTLGPDILVKVLDEAAAAIAAKASSAPDASKAELTSLIIEPPDEHYAWTPILKKAAELLEQSSNAKPQNALLVGPTGCGKTDLALQFAAKYRRPCLILDCANLREARDWFGVKGVANGATYFRKSQFWLAVEKGNCVVVLDEFNRAADHIRNPLMPLLDHRRRSFVEEVGEMLKVGPRTVFLATINEGLDYSGTHSTDRAMKNRFPRRIELSYLHPTLEKSVLKAKVPMLAEDACDKLVELANAIRSKCGFGGGLSESISTRQLIAIAEDFVIGGVGTFQSTVFSHYSPDGGSDSERAQVINMFQLKGFKL